MKIATTLSNNRRQRNECADRPSFKGFPPRTLLETGEIPIEELAEIGLREGQATNPLFRVHRWFARRLSSQFRAILSALSLDSTQRDLFWNTYLGKPSLDGAVVLDPFVGGGTTILEAARCGTRVIGYDIDPVATSITRFELGIGSGPGVPEISETICSEVSKRIRPFHKTRTSDGAEVEVLHHFWVEEITCANCNREFEVHPHYQLAYDQAKKKQWAFCRACHQVYEIALDQETVRCKCGTQTYILQGMLKNGKTFCPFCNEIQPPASSQAPRESPPRWKLFAQEYIEYVGGKTRRIFKAVTEQDLLLYKRAAQSLRRLEAKYGPLAPDRLIPARGRSDGRPLIYGFKRYSQLFNDRQLLHLSSLGRAIRDLPDGSDKKAIAMAFSEHLTTNCMYTAYAFGYRRVSPLFSIHSYRHITRPVEINPWLKNIGRGTFPNALHKIRRAANFAKSPSYYSHRGSHSISQQGIIFSESQVTTTPRRVFHQGMVAAVKTGSSLKLTDIPDRSVDLILTDPPYFDNISYSELSDFYLAWHQALGVAEHPYNNSRRSAPIRANLAVKRKGDGAARQYGATLAAIFHECKRVLTLDGLFVFTYHHRSADAWLALGEALAASGFTCSSVIPMRAEGQGGLHSHNGTLKWDALFVCRVSEKATVQERSAVVVTRSALLKAAQLADQYAARLGSISRIGFRDPDRLNLFRALIVSSAFVGSVARGKISLRDALTITMSFNSRK